MYNPYSAAFAALTNKEARRFYADTALEHSFLTLAVASITAQRTYEAGQAFRQFHDSQLVPFTLLAIAAVVEFFATPEVEVPQLALAGFTPVALLPESKPQARVLVTPCASESRTLVTPAPMVAEVDAVDDLEEVVEVDISGCDDPADVSLAALLDCEDLTEVGDPVFNLSTLNIRELRKLGIERGFGGAGKMSKKALVDLLSAA